MQNAIGAPAAEAWGGPGGGPCSGTAGTGMQLVTALPRAPEPTQSMDGWVACHSGMDTVEEFQMGASAGQLPKTLHEGRKATVLGAKSNGEEALGKLKRMPFQSSIDDQDAQLNIVLD